MGSGRVFKKALKKYGSKNFIKIILADYHTRKEASEHEKMVVTIEVIILPECYNIRTGGDNENTYIPSEEHKQKLSKAHMGKVLLESHRKKIGEANKGRTVSNETRKKISEKNKGKSPTKETREKLRNCNLGKKHSEESKAKMGRKGVLNNFFGKKHSEEANQKNREAHIGRTDSEEVKLKKRAASQGDKPCKIFEVSYKSISDAARQLQLANNTINYRLKSDKPKWSDWGYQNQQS